MEDPCNQVMDTTARLATLGEWFDIYVLFMKAAEKNPLSKHACLSKIAYQIRKRIQGGFVLAIEDEYGCNVGYLCVSTGYVWWTADLIIEEHFVLGRIAGFGRIARGWLDFLAKGHHCLILAGNALSPDKQLTTNGYIKDGYQTSNTFYKEVQ